MFQSTQFKFKLNMNSTIIKQYSDKKDGINSCEVLGAITVILPKGQGRFGQCFPSYQRKQPFKTAFCIYSDYHCLKLFV